MIHITRETITNQLMIYEDSFYLSSQYINKIDENAFQGLKFKIISLSDCNINNIDFLKDVRVKELYLFNNNITDISPLAYKESIIKLKLFNNPTFDLSVLSTLPNLEDIEIGGPDWYIDDIIELFTLTQVKNFNIRFMNIDNQGNYQYTAGLVRYDTKTWYDLRSEIFAKSKPIKSAIQ